MEGIDKGNEDIFYGELLESLVPKDHPYRKILTLIDFSYFKIHLQNLFKKKGKSSIPIIKGFKMLLLQYWENLSDREMERYIRENNPAKFFCGFKLTDKTPVYTYFGKVRRRIGNERLAKLFNEVVTILEKKGFVGNVFHFVDASKLLAKVNLWEARDKAIADKENNEKDDDDNPKMNNSNVSKYSSDKDARFGCKGKKNFFFGYKRTVRVDMRLGVITKTHLSRGNISDHKVLEEAEILPENGMVFADKAYDCHLVEALMRKKGCASGVIKKNNRKGKNRFLDKWRSQVRMPFEGVFSKLRRTTRYRGIERVEFQNTMECLVHNLKKLIQHRKLVVN